MQHGRAARRWGAGLVVGAWILLALGCGDELDLSIAPFSRSCGMDEDCVSVFQGNVCSTCTCGNAAINRGEEDEYRKALRKVKEQCSEPLLFKVSCDCANPIVECVSGICTASSPYR